MFEFGKLDGMRNNNSDHLTPWSEIKINDHHRYEEKDYKVCEPLGR